MPPSAPNDATVPVFSPAQSSRAGAAEAANDDSSAARAAMSLLAESKSRRPLDTPFRQQTLKAWRPILTPKVVVLTFFLVGCVFIPIGCVIITESDKVVEVVVAWEILLYQRPRVWSPQQQ